MGPLKRDIIADAFSRLVISGITVTPSDSDMALALSRLTAMMYDFAGRNMCLNYNFEGTESVASEHNINPRHWYAVSACLALRLMSDFGIDPASNPILVNDAHGSLSYLHASTAPRRQTRYPSRMPIGSANTLRFSQIQRFHQPPPEAPATCNTVKIVEGEKEVFIVSFENFLMASETISTFSFTTDDGLTVTNARRVFNSSGVLQDIEYTLQATSPSGSSGNNFRQIEFTVTSSSGRVKKVVANFEVTADTTQPVFNERRTTTYLSRDVISPPAIPAAGRVALFGGESWNSKLVGGFQSIGLNMGSSWGRVRIEVELPAVQSAIQVTVSGDNDSNTIPASSVFADILFVLTNSTTISGIVDKPDGNPPSLTVTSADPILKASVLVEIFNGSGALSVTTSLTTANGTTQHKNSGTLDAFPVHGYARASFRVVGGTPTVSFVESFTDPAPPEFATSP